MANKQKSAEEHNPKSSEKTHTNFFELNLPLHDMIEKNHRNQKSKVDMRKIMIIFQLKNIIILKTIETPKISLLLIQPQGFHSCRVFYTTH